MDSNKGKINTYNKVTTIATVAEESPTLYLTTQRATWSTPRCRSISSGGEVLPDCPNPSKEWPVKEVMNERVVQGKKRKKASYEYLLNWKGFSHEYDSWEPDSNCQNCRELIDDFLSKCGPIKLEQEMKLVEDKDANDKNKREMELHQNLKAERDKRRQSALAIPGLTKFQKGKVANKRKTTDTCPVCELNWKTWSKHCRRNHKISQHAPKIECRFCSKKLKGYKWNLERHEYKCANKT